jgi:hypothetical protein
MLSGPKKALNWLLGRNFLVEFSVEPRSTALPKELFFLQAVTSDLVIRVLHWFLGLQLSSLRVSGAQGLGVRQAKDTFTVPVCPGSQVLDGPALCCNLNSYIK